MQPIPKANNGNITGAPILYANRPMLHTPIIHAPTQNIVTAFTAFESPLTVYFPQFASVPNEFKPSLILITIYNELFKIGHAKLFVELSY